MNEYDPDYRVRPSDTFQEIKDARGDDEPQTITLSLGYLIKRSRHYEDKVEARVEELEAALAALLERTPFSQYDSCGCAYCDCDYEAPHDDDCAWARAKKLLMGEFKLTRRQSPEFVLRQDYEALQAERDELRAAIRAFVEAFNLTGVDGLGYEISSVNNRQKLTALKRLLNLTT